jgi:hypothetical protein
MDNLLYGDKLQSGSTLETRHYKGIDALDMDAGPDLALIETAQKTVDRMSGWEEIDSSWYLKARDPSSDEIEIDSTKAEEEWARQTYLRWKVGIIHHQEEGLVWIGYNHHHQAAGVSHSGNGDTVIYGQTLGQLLSEIHSHLWSIRRMYKLDDPIIPVELKQWQKEHRGDWVEKWYSLRHSF